MTKEQQQLLWACLPKEARDEIRKDYNSYESSHSVDFNGGYAEALEIYFGEHNLTSDTEPEDEEPAIRQIRKYWTDKEVKFLTENFDKLTDEIMATRLNKSVRAITLKRKKLGLKKDYEMPVLNKKVCGVGHCDVADVRHEGNADAYSAWVGMLTRCYNEKALQRAPTYRGCSVCDEWLTFSNFRKWFYAPENGYKQGLHLDKDLIQIGNKVYSPDTCCFVHPRINKLLIKQGRRTYKGMDLPLGVTFSKGRYIAYCSYGDKIKHLGSFSNPDDAYVAYKIAKEAYIKDVAQDYYNKGLMHIRIYNALMNYEITK